jgi:hypothetical protein
MRSGGRSLLGIVLLLGAKQARTPLPWQALEQAPDFLRGRDWVLIGSVYSTDGTPGSLDAHLKTFLMRDRRLDCRRTGKGRRYHVGPHAPRAHQATSRLVAAGLAEGPELAAGLTGATDRRPAHSGGSGSLPPNPW